MKVEYMKNLDAYIKSRSILDPDIVPGCFEARSDALLESLAQPGQLKNKIRILRTVRLAAAVALVAVLLAGAAVAAYTLSGGDYFKQVFNLRAKSNPGIDYGYMDTEQLSDMASSTVGNVVDTDDLSVDVLGVIVSGNTAQFDIKVTAKKLDSVLYDTGIEPLMNYRFHDFYNLFLLEDGVKKDTRGSTGSIGHIYSDEDESLAPNQFIIRYTFISDEPLKDKTYVMTYKDFGYFNFDEPDQFVELYTGEWSFNIVFDPAGDTSKTVMTGQGLSAGGYDFTVNSVEITPLTCTAKISSDEEYYDRLDSRWQDVWNALYDKVQGFTVSFKDGTRLDSSQLDFSGSGGGQPGLFEVHVQFKVPIPVEQVASVTMGGIEIPLK
jgi:hypothetical protein